MVVVMSAPPLEARPQRAVRVKAGTKFQQRLHHLLRVQQLLVGPHRPPSLVVLVLVVLPVLELRAPNTLRTEKLD